MPKRSLVYKSKLTRSMSLLSLHLNIQWFFPPGESIQTLQLKNEKLSLQWPQSHAIPKNARLVAES